MTWCTFIRPGCLRCLAHPVLSEIIIITSSLSLYPALFTAVENCSVIPLYQESGTCFTWIDMSASKLNLLYSIDQYAVDPKTFCRLKLKLKLWKFASHIVTKSFSQNFSEPILISILTADSRPYFYLCIKSTINQFGLCIL